MEYFAIQSTPCQLAPVGDAGSQKGTAMEMESQQANDLLQEAQRLKAQAHAARQWTWLPLVVFGGLSLLASPLYDWSIPRWVTEVYWLVAGPIGYAVCARYHRQRRERTGVGGVPVRPYIATGVILLLGLVSMLPFHLEFFAVAVALLVLARRERSWSLAVIAAVFGTLSLIAGLYNTDNLYHYSGNLYHYSGAFADSIKVVVLGAFLLGTGLVLRARSGDGEAGDPSHR
jgi:hypothetical protein